ncbi:hypothetical protein ACWYRQ_15780 [Clostridioides difficile]
MLRKDIDIDWIKEHPWDLKDAKIQTYEMCIESIKKDGLFLKDIRWDELDFNKEQVNNLCLMAVKENGLALEYVKNQTEEICREALRQNKQAVIYIEDGKIPKRN